MFKTSHISNLKTTGKAQYSGETSAHKSVQRLSKLSSSNALHLIPKIEQKENMPLSNHQMNSHLAPKMEGNELAPIQLKSNPRYTERTLKYDEGGGDEVQQVTVGINSDVTINGNVDTGSEPSFEAPIYAGRIRGHVLNQELGGDGIAMNLFPFTSSQNHSHNTHIEEPAKSLYRDTYRETRQRGDVFYYHSWLKGNVIDDINAGKIIYDLADLQKVEAEGEWYIRRANGAIESRNEAGARGVEDDPDFIP